MGYGGKVFLELNHRPWDPNSVLNSMCSCSPLKKSALKGLFLVQSKRSRGGVWSFEVKHLHGRQAPVRTGGEVAHFCVRADESL